MNNDVSVKKFSRQFNKNLEFNNFSLNRDSIFDIASISCSLIPGDGGVRRASIESPYYDQLFFALFDNIHRLSILKTVESPHSYIRIDLGEPPESEFKLIDPALTLFVGNFDFSAIHGSLISDSLITSISVHTSFEELDLLNEYFIAPSPDQGICFNKFTLKTRKLK